MAHTKDNGLTGAGLQRLPFATATVAEVVTRLDEHGYVIVEDILAPAGVETIGADLRSMLESEEFCQTRFLGRHTKRLYGLPSRTRSCDVMLVHPFALCVLDQVLGHYLLSSTTVTDIYPGEPAQTLHTDDSSWPVHFLAVAGEIELGVLWAVSEFTEENGATRMVPGSHRWPVERRKAYGDEQTVPVEMRPGSALFYSGRVLHGGGANVSDAPRLGVVLTYVRSWLRQQENFVVTSPREVAQQFPARLQEVVGYDVYPPLLGHIDGRHPSEYLSGIPRTLDSAPS